MPDSFQAHFHRRWNHLDDPHVRDLAWLLDAPDMLDPAAPCWRDRIASLPDGAASDAAAWLTQLDEAPAALHAWLDLRPMSRLGRYAEKLLAFYFRQQGTLVSHGVQVRRGDQTIGEFDFLLRHGQALAHWEFAAKFYLLESGGAARNGVGADYFVGPNLADTLGAKMEKILQKQLALAQHPAAQAVLPQPVAESRALVKGWLFYHRGETASAAGLHPRHCRGWWRSLEEFSADAGAVQRYCILPRLSWLAPARRKPDQTLDAAALIAAAAAHFGSETMPLLIAALREQDGQWLESEREFLVPDDWRQKAVQRIAAR